MSLLVGEKHTFKIDLKYFLKDQGITILTKEGQVPEGTQVKSETFTFKRPNWSEIQKMMSACVICDASTGRAIMDPYKFMDIKVKTLLRDWTLKDEEGNKMPLVEDTLSNMEPSVVQYLFDEMNEVLEPTNAS